MNIQTQKSLSEAQTVLAELENDLVEAKALAALPVTAGMRAFCLHP
jgi:hypothetical protein